MKQTKRRNAAFRRGRKRRSDTRANIIIRYANSMINSVRKWFLRKPYAPAVCLGSAVVLSMIVVCAFALPVPKGITVSSPSSSVIEVAAAQTQIPDETFSADTDSSLYDELTTPSSSDTVSAFIDDEEETASNVTVYAAEDADCYHLGDCKFAFASSKRLTAYEAYYLGYKPCGRCNPPVYDPVTGTCK